MPIEREDNPQRDEPRSKTARESASESNARRDRRDAELDRRSPTPGSAEGERDPSEQSK